MNLAFEIEKRQVTKTCLGCGRSFTVYLSWSDRKYCSLACNPHYQGIRVEFKCKNCDRLFRVHPSRGRPTFCGERCKIEWLAKNFSGENSPHWRGGRADNYGAEWPRISKRIILRDGSHCVLCYASRPLVVHHYIPFMFWLENFGRKVAESLGHSDGNLVTLCRTCHMRLEHHLNHDFPPNPREFAPMVIMAGFRPDKWPEATAS